MSPMPLARVVGPVGTLLIGTIVREMPFHRSLIRNGMTGWKFVLKSV